MQSLFSSDHDDIHINEWRISKSSLIIVPYPDFSEVHIHWDILLSPLSSYVGTTFNPARIYIMWWPPGRKYPERLAEEVDGREYDYIIVGGMSDIALASSLIVRHSILIRRWNRSYRRMCYCFQIERGSKHLSPPSWSAVLPMIPGSPEYLLCLLIFSMRAPALRAGTRSL